MLLLVLEELVCIALHPVQTGNCCSEEALSVALSSMSRLSASLAASFAFKTFFSSAMAEKLRLIDWHSALKLVPNSWERNTNSSILLQRPVAQDEVLYLDILRWSTYTPKMSSREAASLAKVAVAAKGWRQSRKTKGGFLAEFRH